MKKEKHTEGNWKYRPDIVGNSFYIETVDQSHDRTFIGEIGGGLQSKIEIEANAKLVSTAPELLEACQRALEVFESENITGQARLLLAVAIKKAVF
jgi:hypothetical protein